MDKNTAGCCSGHIEISTSVSAIGPNAFRECASLSSVTIPTSVSTIGSFLFNYCYSLSSVTIPTSVRTIGDRAFYEYGSILTIAQSV